MSIPPVRDEPIPHGPIRSRWLRLGRLLRTIPFSVTLSLIILTVLAVWAAIPELLVPNALSQDLGIGVTPAGTPGHFLGTDTLGRDVLALTIAGTRSALVGPLVIALGSMILGIVFGLTAAWFGGWWDAIVSRTSEILLSVPVTLLAIVVAGILGGSYWVTVAVLVVLFAPSDIRMIRAAALQQMPKPYLESARVLGLSTPRILRVHLLPNVLPIVWANLFVNVAFALVSISGLSYLGFGVSAQAADWGRQLADGRAFIFQNPAACVVPGLFIIGAATAINIAGDWWSSRSAERIAQ
ncbi:ABC transporter permease [Schaalia sp. ZJ405]|uniref:ABC transporter permease n=1 Tax=Schaalia sp. ZJ405 TaxID=2709403 RepID=UPI0013E9EF67|nr:ABC transporter permease [Schaalia sp. ZJ405]QPK80650.1 ABC transporter permease [Schaalia sp. ZJ405]